MEYENYDETSQTYDNVRKPNGLDSLEKALVLASQGTGCSVNQLNVIDIGCGTGNYITAIKEKVATCTGLEFNAGMLAQAKKKHDGDERITMVEGSVLNMKLFDDAKFNVVIMTQVLHHLAPEIHAQALAEIARVLKPGGTFWIQTCTPHQVMDGIWWAPLIPQAAAKLASRFPDLPLFESQLETAGFSITEVSVPDDPLIQKAAYLDQNGPFTEEFRNGDSTWSMASPQELEAGLAWWKKQKDEGKAEAFMEAREKLRSEIGQTTSVTSVKK